MANAAKVQVSGSYDGDAATAHVDTFARQHLPPRELWPEFVFTRPELHYPARLNCVSYFLDRWVELGHGDAPCVISPAVSYTYRELQGLVNRIEYQDSLARTNNWLPLTNITVSTKPYVFGDSTALGQPHRFYRVLLQ